MPKLAGPWHPLLGALVRALHVEAFVDTTLYAPADARVVLHRSTLRVWLDGVACTLVTELQFRLLEILIIHAGQPVHTKDVAAHIARGNFHEDTTRRALEGLVSAIEKSFKAQKRKAPKDVGELIGMPRRGYYVLRVMGFVD
jgi:DNA-binding response OmpR family regulator